MAKEEERRSVRTLYSRRHHADRIFLSWVAEGVVTDIQSFGGSGFIVIYPFQALDDQVFSQRIEGYACGRQ